MTNLLENIDISNIKDVIIDVQGAELEVLKSFDDKIENFNNIKTEVSTISYYKDQVLFPELNNFLNKKGFYTDKIPTKHCDLVYKKINIKN